MSRSTAKPTHELYSWSARTGHWLAVDQGTEEEMTEAETRRYETSRRHDMTGSAFWVSEVDDPPGLRPEDLGVEVVES